MRAAAWALGAWLLGCLPAAAAPAAGPFFPPPPEQPRLAWELEIRGSDGYRAPRGWLARLGDLLTGGPAAIGLARPHGLGTDGTVLLVADPDAGLVHRFDLAAGLWSPIPATGALSIPVDAAAAPGGDIWISEAGAARVSVFSAAGEFRFACALDGGRPAGLIYDPGLGRCVVADAAGHRLVLLGPDGASLGEIGRRGTGPGEFNFPVDVALLPDGGLAVLDALNFRVQLLAAGGGFRSAFGVQGDAPGCLARPRGLTVTPGGRLVVSDAQTDRFQIFDLDGRLLLVVGRPGRQAGEFWMPAGVAADGRETLYVADAYNRRVQAFRLLGGAEGDAP